MSNIHNVLFNIHIDLFTLTNQTKVRPIFPLSHRGSDTCNFPLLKNSVLIKLTNQIMTSIGLAENNEVLTF